MWQFFRLKSLCLSLTLSDHQINSFVVKVWESALPRHNRKVNTWITCKSTVDLSKRSSQKITIFYYSVCDRNMSFCFVIKSHLDSYASTLLKFYVYSFSRLLNLFGKYRIVLIMDEESYYYEIHVRCLLNARQGMIQEDPDICISKFYWRCWLHCWSIDKIPWYHFQIIPNSIKSRFPFNNNLCCATEMPSTHWDIL